MFPVLPLSVNKVLLLPAHTVTFPPLMLPATAAGLTVTTTLVVVAGEHGALVSTAR